MRNFKGEHQYSLVERVDDISRHSEVDVIFDFLPEKTQPVVYPTGSVVFLNSVQTLVSDLVWNINSDVVVFGFNGLPTFLEGPCLEISALNNNALGRLSEIMSDIGKEFVLVKDQTGMVTPRIIFMIINEAYLAVEEGTANREDVDLAMKLGTNYPFGPFEWSSRIGIKSIYETLDALYRSTKDERYRISSLLREEYLRDAKSVIECD